MARVAVFHNTLDFQGGADAVCLHACAALAADHDVTLFTASRTEPAALADRFDLPFEADVVRPPGANVLAAAFETLGPYAGAQLAARSALLRGIARHRLDRYDAVVSTANELSLPVPSVQYVHFPQFHLSRVDTVEHGRLNWLWSRVAAPERVGPGARTRFVANSAWTADAVEQVYGVRPAVCHPPVDRIEGRPWTDREDGILVLGRIAPDKRVLDAIAVLDNLRERGYGLTGHVVGSAPPGYREYVARVRRAASDRPYLTVETDVDRDRVLDLLGRYRYGLNAKPREHFGMAVAEFVAAGMLPFAPDEGGQVDVLAGDERLLFDGPSEAVDRIASAVDADLRPSLPRDRFGSERFAGEIREHVAAILR
jgi:glycosyltransferase involved in cell wall biosynthesis